MRPSLGSRAACPRAPLHAVVLKFVAFASARPLGQADYRTLVREAERLRKEVYSCGQDHSEDWSVPLTSSHSSRSAEWLAFWLSSSCDWRCVSSGLTKLCNAVSSWAISSSARPISPSSCFTRSSICLRFRGFRRFLGASAVLPFPLAGSAVSGCFGSAELVWWRLAPGTSSSVGATCCPPSLRHR